MREEEYLKIVSKEIAENYKKALLLMRSERNEDAEILLRNIIERATGFAPAHNKIGVMYAAKKDRGEAEAWFNMALQIDSEFAPSLTNLGSLAAEKGDQELAKQYYLRAIEIDGSYGPAHKNLAVIYKKEGNIHAFMRHLKRSRRASGLSAEIIKKRVFYKEPGCIVPSALLIIILAVYLFTRIL